MRFLDRLSLLVKADAHGVLEQLEERSLLAKQHLREAELELGRKRARVEALEEEERRLAEERSRLGSEISSLDEDVSLALSGDKEELARFALRKLLPKRRTSEELSRRGEEIRGQRARIAQKLEQQQQDFEQLQRRVRAQLAQARQERVERVGAVEDPAADEEIELELLRRRSAGTPARESH